MRKSLKIVLFAIIMLLAMLLIANSNVQAATYQSMSGDTKITVVTENGKVTITQEQEGEAFIAEYVGIGEVIGLNGSTLIMKQEEINKYINAREIPYTIKQKVDSTVNKAELEDGTELTIETINNNKWVVYSGNLPYEPTDIGKVWDDYIVEYKNDDIRYVSLGLEDNEIDGFYINGNKTEEGYINTVWSVVQIETEKTVGADVYFHTNFVNERNVDYAGIGGMGGFIMGYTKLHPIYDLTKYNNNVPFYLIPEKADLSKVYLKLRMSAYQGESIVLKNNKGTLYYEGKENSMYIYKNKVSNLKIKENEVAEFSYKLTNGYQLDGHFNTVYRLDPNAIETVVKVEDSTKNEQKIDNKVGISYWGDATFNIAKVEKTDSIYARVEDEMNSKLPKYNRTLYLDIVDIYRVEGDFGGKLTITFDVDEKYNGKYYHVSHYTGLGEYERFEGVVANGKITVTVSSLSPFGIAIYEKTAAPSKEPADRELDDEPPTGVNIVNTVVVATLAVVTLGAIAMIKNNKD